MTLLAGRMGLRRSRPRTRWHRVGGMADRHLWRVVDVAQLSLPLGHALTKPNWYEVDGEPWYHHPEPGRVRRERGWWSVCRTCGARFPSLKVHPGIYCSKLCWAKARVGKTLTRPDLFAQWTPEECWLAGLIWSDGCLHDDGRVRAVSFTSTDQDLAESVAGLTGSTVRPYARKPPNKMAYKVQIGGRPVIERLVAVGLEPRKSLTTYMPRLPHLDAFIRGYFDGDGSVGLYRKPGNSPDYPPRLVSSFVGTARMVTQIQEILHAQKGIPPKKLVARENIWQVTLSHQASCRLAQFMYADGGPHLSRKKRIFDEGMAYPFPTPRSRGVRHYA